MKMNGYYWRYDKIPCVKGIASKMADNKIKINNPFVKRFIKRAKIFQVFYFIRLMLNKEIYLNRLALVTSYKCTLNCQGCGQHTPFIKKMDKEYKKIDMALIKESMDKLMDAVGGIGLIGLANGEAFINENLLDAIEYVGNCEKIGGLNLPTNGTVLPSDEILKAMKKYHVTATITKYDCVPQEKIDQMKDAFDRYGIHYTVYEDRHWFDLSRFDLNLKNRRELKAKFRHCEKNWILINNTDLSRCVSYTTAVFCGRQEKREDEFIPLHLLNKQQIRKRIMEIAVKPYLDACTRCRGISGKDVIEIPAGRQNPVQKENGRGY